MTKKLFPLLTIIALPNSTFFLDGRMPRAFSGVYALFDLVRYVLAIQKSAGEGALGIEKLKG